MTRHSFGRHTFHVPNLIGESGTAEERRMNQISSAEFGAAKVRHKFGRACMSHYATLKRQ